MNFNYSAAQLELKQRARGLARSIMGYEEQCDAEDGLPPEALPCHRQEHARSWSECDQHAGGMGRCGSFDLRPGARPRGAGPAHERPLGHRLASANTLRACTPEQRERYLIPAIKGERRDCYAVTESEAGSDFTAIESTAEPDGDGYRLNGEKWFVTVGDVADFFIVMAKVLPSGGSTLFLVDKDSPGSGALAHAALHAPLRLQASHLHLRERPGRARPGAGGSGRW